MAKPKKTVSKNDAKSTSPDESPAKDAASSGMREVTPTPPTSQDNKKSGADEKGAGAGAEPSKKVSDTSATPKDNTEKAASAKPEAAAGAAKATPSKTTPPTTASNVPKTTSAAKSGADTKPSADKKAPGSDPTEAKKASRESDKTATTAAATPPKDSVKPASSETSSSQISAAKSERKRSVFLPLVLGGAVAAGLGFAASEYDLLQRRGADTAEWQSALEAQQARIAELEARAEEPAALPESLPQVDALAEELQAVRQEIAALQEQLGQIDGRLTTVEKEPATGGGNEVAVAAFEREMEALRQSVAAQREEIEGLLDNAESVEEATAAAAEAARAQAAMTRINGALAAGRPYEAALAELQAAGVGDIPASLTETAPSGVVTLANLQARYPEAARAALATARAETEAEGNVGFTGFLKRQLGARSVAPREGTDPDAVLSRAEAAVRDGRLTDALAEIDTLPEAAQSAMADWLADARARQAAETAADDLSQRLTAN